MRNVFATALIIALLATGTLVAVDLATLLASGPAIAVVAPPETLDSDSEELVQAFYNAANDVLAGGTPAALAAILSPDAETHAETGEIGLGEAPLLEHFSAVRQRGDVQIGVVRLIGSGTEVAALVEARRPGVTGANSSPEQTLPLWRATDLFRIDDGVVVAYWPGPIEVLPPPPLPTAVLHLSLRDLGVSVARLELEPGSGIEEFRAPAHHLLIVENGMLSVSRRSALAVARAGEPMFFDLPASLAADDVVLTAGDALLLSEEAGPRLRNPSAAHASLLSVLIAPRAVLFDLKHALPKDALTVTGMHDPWRVGNRVTWPEGAASETLAVSFFAGPSAGTGIVELKAMPTSLRPGEQLPPLPADSLRVLIAQSGTLTIVGNDIVRAYEPSMRPFYLKAANRLLRAGEAMSIATGESPTIENTGARAADLLIIQAVVNGAVPAATPAARQDCPETSAYFRNKMAEAIATSDGTEPSGNDQVASQSPALPAAALFVCRPAATNDASK